MPRIGCLKLHRLLRSDFIRLGYKLGRDKFFELMRGEKFLVVRRKRKCGTTNSTHDFRVYANLIADLKIRRPFQVLVSDITYLRVGENFCYLSLVTDLFSRLIVGWELSKTLEAAGPLRALRMALRFTGALQGAIHHSDRGVQYCCHEYVKLLFHAKIRISMSNVGAPEQNAVAERVNGILKDEFLLEQQFPSFEVALPATREAIATYNQLRPHLSLDHQTPLGFLKKHLRR
jgi:transposase InsO family protein